MRVLLVQAYLGRKEKGGPVFPLGLAYLASVLNNQEVKVLDLNVGPDPHRKLEREISNFDPEVVGLSVRNVDTTWKRDIFLYFKEVKPTVELIRRKMPSAKIVIGGPGFSMFAKTIMERISEIDVGVYLEGEESFPELLANLDNPEKVKGLFVRKDGGIHFTGTRDFPNFAALPMPDRSILDLKPYLGPYKNIGIQTKRGCPLHCAYCCYPFLNGRRLRMRSAAQVVDEVELLCKKYNVREFMFVDPVFNAPIKCAEDICREIIARRLDVEWNAYFDLKNISEEFILLAQRAGCVHFMFSPDAITAKGLNRLRKDYTVKEIQNAFAVARKIKGARFDYSLFCNHPGQDLLGLVKTVLFYLKGNLLLFGKGGVELNWIRIEPNTEIRQIAISEGVMESETELLPEYERELRSLYYNPPPIKYLDPSLNLLFDVSHKFKALLKSTLSWFCNP